MYLVRSRLDGHVDLPRALTVFSRVKAGLDLHFLNRKLGGQAGGGGEEVVGVGHTVYREADGVGAGSIDTHLGEIFVQSVIRKKSLRAATEVRCARTEPHQIIEITSAGRELFVRLLIKHTASRGVV